MRTHLGDVYEPGFPSFAALLADWRDKGDLAGLVLAR
jgi:cyclohexanone monooxygenase